MSRAANTVNEKNKSDAYPAKMKEKGKVDDSFRDTLDELSLSVVTFLSNHQGVQDVTLAERESVTAAAINDWETAHAPLQLPADYKAFMESSDGLLLQWNVIFRGRILPFGCMHLNKLEDVKVVENKSFVYEHVEKLTEKSPFRQPGRVFDLDNMCPTGGCVAFVFPPGNDTAPEVWFRDLGHQWVFIAKTFTDYFRLMVSHLGVPHWQYAFTSAGLDPITLQWFAFLSPERLQIDMEHRIRATRRSNRDDLAKAAPTRRVVPLGTPTEQEKQKEKRKERRGDRWISFAGVAGGVPRRRRRKRDSSAAKASDTEKVGVVSSNKDAQNQSGYAAQKAAAAAAAAAASRPYSAPLRRKSVS